MRRTGAETARVLIDGWYGYQNTGDDAFCVVATHVAATEWGIGEPWVAGRGDRLPQMLVPTRDVVPHPPRFPGHVRAAIAKAAVRARAIVHAGGSTLRRVPRNLKDQLLLQRAELVDIHLAGVSIGPFTSRADAERMVSVVRGVSSVSVRDHASRERLLDIDPAIPVTVGFDIAVLLPEVARVEAAVDNGDSRKVIGLSLCPAESQHGGDLAVERERMDRTIDLVRRVVRRTGATVRLLEFCGHPAYGDRRALRGAAAALSADTDIEYVRYGRDPASMMSAVAATDFVIGMRLHASLFAFSVGVPCLIVPYQKKGVDVGLMHSKEEFIAPLGGPDPGHAEVVEEALASGIATASLSPAVARDQARRALPDLGPTAAIPGHKLLAGQ